jgi:hypothetical protein
MSESEGIPERVTRLEHEMLEVRADAKAARVLAAGADHDVSRVESVLRAQKSLIEALRETQVEQGQRIDEGFAKMDEGFGEIRSKFAMVDEGFGEMRSKFATVGLGLEQITALLTDEMNKPDKT